MSLLIDTNKIMRVLLADGWHECEPGSFDTDSYEFGYWPNADSERNGDFFLTHGGGNSGVCATGFVFTEKPGSRIYGPLTAVLAVEEAKIADGVGDA